MVVSVPPMMPGLINSINANIHVGVGTRLFDLAYLLGVSTPSLWFHTHSTFLSCRILLYSSLWHRPSILRSRGFSPLTKRCSITQSWDRRRSRTMGAFPAAMKRRLMFIGLTSRPLHRFSEIWSQDSGATLWHVLANLECVVSTHRASLVWNANWNAFKFIVVLPRERLYIRCIY
jgi:hypothetical protein